MMNGRTWTESEFNIFQGMVDANIPLKKIAQIMGRSYEAVKSAKRRLNPPEKPRVVAHRQPQRHKPGRDIGEPIDEPAFTPKGGERAFAHAMEGLSFQDEPRAKSTRTPKFMLAGIIDRSLTGGSFQ